MDVLDLLSRLEAECTCLFCQSEEVRMVRSTVCDAVLKADGKEWRCEGEDAHEGPHRVRINGTQVSWVRGRDNEVLSGREGREEPMRG